MQGMQVPKQIRLGGGSYENGVLEARVDLVFSETFELGLEPRLKTSAKIGNGVAQLLDGLQEIAADGVIDVSEAAEALLKSAMSGLAGKQ